MANLLGDIAGKAFSLGVGYIWALVRERATLYIAATIVPIDGNSAMLKISITNKGKSPIGIDRALGTYQRDPWGMVYYFDFLPFGSWRPSWNELGDSVGPVVVDPGQTMVRYLAVSDYGAKGLGYFLLNCRQLVIVDSCGSSHSILRADLKRLKQALLAIQLRPGDLDPHPIEWGRLWRSTDRYWH